jgi:hypothetical protein
MYSFDSVKVLDGFIPNNGERCLRGETLYFYLFFTSSLPFSSQVGDRVDCSIEVPDKFGIKIRAGRDRALP